MLFFLSSVSSLIQCKNALDHPVDTWAAFKVPSSVGISGRKDTGIAYFYRDDSTALALGEGDVSSTTSNPIYFSLSPLWSKASDIGYALFNDQPPDTDNISTVYAHLKGVILFDKDGGLYLVHTVPNFPPDPKQKPYSYPQSGTKYGQAFECFSFSFDQLELISKDLLIERPWVYASNFPNEAKTRLPSLKKVIDGQYNKSATNQVTQLVTAGGIRVTHLAKSKSWGLDLYHDLVAPTFQSNVLSETWALGTGNLPSNCTGKYSSLNVLTVSFEGTQWKRTQDHSKWAVTTSSTVCIGDINRQKGQFVRGGGTFCRTNSPFAKEITAVIVESEPCP